MSEKNNLSTTIQLGVGAVVFHNDCVLLVKRKNPPNQNQWAIPGGKVKFAENLKAAAAREIEEETGIRIEVLDPVFTFDVIGSIDEKKYHYVVIDYAANYISGDINASDDAQEAAWVSRKDLARLEVNPITLDLLKDKYQFP